jgi:hypothetical protein
MSEDSNEVNETVEVEAVQEDVVVFILESVLLDLIRAVAAPDKDADLIYMEFWANSRVSQILSYDDECECCECPDENFDPDVCECECICDDQVLEEADAEADDEAG